MTHLDSLRVASGHIWPGGADCFNSRKIQTEKGVLKVQPFPLEQYRTPAPVFWMAGESGCPCLKQSIWGCSLLRWHQSALVTAV